MSLIQEALKRQQQDLGEGELKDGPPPSQRPSLAPAPPPVPPPGAEQEETPPPADATAEPAPAEGPAPWERGYKKPETKKQKITKIVTLIVLFGSVFGAIAFHTLPMLFNKPAAPPSQPTQPEPEPVEPIAPDPTAIQTGAAGKVAKTPTQPEVKQPTPTAIEPIPIEPEPLELKPPVVWPAIEVNGIVGREKNGSALLNGEIVAVGDSIEGAKVISIKGQTVELEFQGERQTVRPGSSTQ